MHSARDDDRLLRTKGQHSLAFACIYRAWRPRVSRWVRNLGARPCDHEDLVQDVFIVVFRRLSEFNGDNLPGWLYRIARRKVRDYRQLYWVRHALAFQGAVLDQAQQPGPNPLDALETNQKSRVLRQRLAKLSPAQLATFTLFEVDGLSGHEIAEQEQVSLNTVWLRLYNARRKLRFAKTETRGSRTHQLVR